MDPGEEASVESSSRTDGDLEGQKQAPTKTYLHAIIKKDTESQTKLAVSVWILHIWTCVVAEVGEQEIWFFMVLHLILQKDECGSFPQSWVLRHY